jgi:hypothetical protein
MALKELSISELLELPDHEPLWVLNNSMNAVGRYTRITRPSDVLIDIRKPITGKLFQSHVMDIVNAVSDAMVLDDTAAMSHRDKFLEPMKHELSVQLTRELRLESTRATTIVVPHDYRGFPFDCAVALPRQDILANGNFRAALEKKLVIGITTEDAEWLIAYLETFYEGFEEPDRHRAFQHLCMGVEKDETNLSNTLTVCPVDRIRDIFDNRDRELARRRALAARPWYVKLYSWIRGGE